MGLGALPPAGSSRRASGQEISGVKSPESENVLDLERPKGGGGKFARLLLANVNWLVVAARLTRPDFGEIRDSVRQWFCWL